MFKLLGMNAKLLGKALKMPQHSSNTQVLHVKQTRLGHYQHFQTIVNVSIGNYDEKCRGCTKKSYL